MRSGRLSDKPSVKKLLTGIPHTRFPILPSGFAIRRVQCLTHPRLIACCLSTENSDPQPIPNTLAENSMIASQSSNAQFSESARRETYSTGNVSALMPGCGPQSGASDLNEQEALNSLFASRGRPAWQMAKRAGANIDRAFRQKLAKAGPDPMELAAHWAEIVGADLARVSKPEKITGKAGERTLHLLAAGPAALVLQHQIGRLRQSVNLYLGSEDIAQIRLKQGSVGASRQPRADANAPGAPSDARLSPSNLHRLDADLQHQLDQFLSDIDNRVLRRALQLLGQAVYAKSETNSNRLER